MTFPDRAVQARRSRVIGVVGAIAVVICAAQLFIIQIVRGPALAEQGRIVRTAATEIQAPRGTILAADGQLLVDSVQTYHVAVNQQKIREWEDIDSKGKVVGTGPVAAAKKLAPLLGLDPAELGGKMLGDSSYVYLAKSVDAQTFREIKKLGIYGIEWEPVIERIYPEGNTAATVIGSVDNEGTGNSGLELVYDKLLQGTPGEESYEVGPTGEVMPGAKSVSKEAKSGGSVHTSLNIDLSNAVQRDLDAAVGKYQADWGAVVVLEAATSRVLVLADSGQRSPSLGPQASRAVQMVFEPGSVGKIITAATALEEGTAEPMTAYTVPDTYVTDDGEKFTDLHQHETYPRTLAGILTESSNTGTVMVGQGVSDQKRYDMMRNLGLGEETGIELPGESAGILPDVDQWQGRLRYTTMFGQGYAMTALQEAALMAALGNGGVWQAPRVVDGWTDADGHYHAEEKAPLRQAVTPENAQNLLRIMEGVSTNKQYGTGQGAAVEGYRTAIKTGTAELPEGGTVATVAGVIPADSPKLAIAVVLYNPKAGVLSSDSAAPLFKQVAQSAVRILGIPASKGAPDLYPMTP